MINKTVRQEAFMEAMRAFSQFRSYNNMSREIIIIDTRANIAKMKDALESLISITYESDRNLDGLKPSLKNVDFYKYLGSTIIFIEKEELILHLIKDKPW